MGASFTSLLCDENQDTIVGPAIQHRRNLNTQSNAANTNRLTP